MNNIIKHFEDYVKKYENKIFEAYYFNNYKNYNIDELEEGYYVKANYGKIMDKDVLDFLDKNFGIVTSIEKNKNRFFAQYKNVPENIKNYFLESGYMRLEFNINGLIEYAPTKEELELKLSSGKYNI
jgi:hypothetical protein